MWHVTLQHIAELTLKEQAQLKAGINQFMGTELDKKIALAERQIEAGVEDEQEESARIAIS